MDDEQLLDYEEEQEETMESADKTENGGPPNATKAKATHSIIYIHIPNHIHSFRVIMPQFTAVVSVT
jgi:hypothetical protein